MDEWILALNIWQIGAFNINLQSHSHHEVWNEGGRVEDSVSIFPG